MPAVVVDLADHFLFAELRLRGTLDRFH